MKQFKIKRSKYGATKVNGYDSRKESRRADVLKLMEKQALISDLREQVKFLLLPKQEVKDFKGKTICGRREMSYVADFVYVENGQTIVEDAKGFRTKEYKRKRGLMLKIHNIIIKET